MSSLYFSRVSSLALVLAAGASITPAGAQQRTEIVVRRTPRAETGDTTERQLRVLQRQLDSLSRVYIESEDLTVAQRRKVEEVLGVTVERMNALSMRLSGSIERAPRASEMVRMQLTPMQGERASSEMSRALMQVREVEAAMPRGWIGIVAQGPALEPRVEGGELIVRYFSYPVIVSVDPSSPAQRAGVIPSDTLIAYNGRDVRENEISLTRLLTPNARINVRVLRDGKLRDIPVIAAAAPTRIVQRRGDEVRITREPWVVDGLPEAPGFPRIPMQPQVAPMPATAPVARARSMFVLTMNGVAGAQMTTITEGLAQAVGVSSGVLVTNAPVSSLAYESGLRDGDVIVKVEGRPVESFGQVRERVQAASNNGEHNVDLEIVRNRKAQKMTLRW